MSRARPAGCVLAGGQSRRMGHDKARLPWAGRPLIEHALGQLRAAGCQPLIAGCRADLRDYAPVVEDLHPGCGPLSGIEAALALYAPGASHPRPDDHPICFLPVDLPLLPPGILALLLERAGRTGALATIPTVGGHPQPLSAVYRPSLLPRVTRALEAGDYKVMRAICPETRSGPNPGSGAVDLFSVEALLASLDPSSRSRLEARQPPAHLWFANMNTPDDLAALERCSPRTLEAE